VILSGVVCVAMLALGLNLLLPLGSGLETVCVLIAVASAMVFFGLRCAFAIKSCRTGRGVWRGVPAPRESEVRIPSAPPASPRKGVWGHARSPRRRG
jgi:hypothetical protein